jgi:2-succinyl-5-enolpyruvyl-6-hydroxy-3-cyclohexene-1-carboxylate synthase
LTLHGKTTHLRTSVEQLAQAFTAKSKLPTPYSDVWSAAEAKVRSGVDQTMVEMNQLFEGKAAWLISQILPPETPLFIANSTPVRDVEFFGHLATQVCDRFLTEELMALMALYRLL